MFRSNSETTTTTSTNSAPLSPFSNYSAPSEPTSDELPDLGHFTTVLRELYHLQPTPRAVNASLALQQQQHASTISGDHRSSLLRHYHSQSDLDSDSELRHPRSTVWAHRPIASYLAPGATVTTDTEHEVLVNPIPPYHHRTPRAESPTDSAAIPSELDEGYLSSDTEGEAEPRTVPIELISDLDYISNSSSNRDDEPRHDDLNIEELDQPSLGFLDEALRFIAAERERFNAQLDADAKWKNGDSRRKRRRKRTKTPRGHSPSRTTTSGASTAPLEPGSTVTSPDQGEDGDQDADESSSSYDRHDKNNDKINGGYLFKSTPGTPSRRRDRERGRGKRPPGRLRNIQSSPHLRLNLNGRSAMNGDGIPAPRHVLDEDEENPRASYMKSLGEKLGKLFPEDSLYLEKVQFRTLLPLDPDHDQTELLGGYVDTTGPSPMAGDTLIHVFIDHSNILFGLLNFLKRYPHLHPQYRASPIATPSGPKPPKHISHSALALILERGRPVTRRVLVTSSPLYQSIEGAQQLGYQVHIYARVPDTGNGMDRIEKERNRFAHGRSLSGGMSATGQQAGEPRRGRWRAGSGSNGSGRKNNHVRKVSGSTSTESEQGGGFTGFPNAFIRSLTSPNISTAGVSSSLPSASSFFSPPTTAGTPANLNPPLSSRIRYREQGVDELLQLKLHQALLSIDGPPPPNSTIVLATGDGNVGQFNEDGFLGSVRSALKKGWRVELYAWEGGLSRSWKREFGEGSEWGTTIEGENGPRFKVIGMEQFGAELVEVYF
ncbi:hypothetical protein C8J56DRAFT_1039745 [Mycena floridula]|nr:hypothetical protein C8J56DRAFT_1039745 [Mycena floridula]